MVDLKKAISLETATVAKDQQEVQKQRGVSKAAEIAETRAFESILKKLGKPNTFAEPAGFDAGFPDFGFSVQLGTRRCDIHVEYKMDDKAQMGSMRDWRYDGFKFYSPDANNEDKKDLIELMNDSAECVRNGKRLLSDLKNYFSKDVKEISSGALSIIKDQPARRIALANFITHTDNYHLAKIDNTQIGGMIIAHYKKKFKKSQKAAADCHILLMMLKDKIWLVDTAGGVSKQDLAQIAMMFGVDRIPDIGSLSAKLEVRIQPRGMSGSNLNKPVSLDVMASFRLSGGLTAGAKII
jgi:hypothetical protein